MFRIPSFYEMEMSFSDAKYVIKSLIPNGTLLDGMEHMDLVWEAHCANQEVCDDEFYSTYMYEINAFNTVLREMEPLLVPVSEPTSV